MNVLAIFNNFYKILFLRNPVLLREKQQKEMTTPKAVPYIMDPSESFFLDLHSSLWIIRTSKDILSLSPLPRKTYIFTFICHTSQKPKIDL